MLRSLIVLFSSLMVIHGAEFTFESKLKAVTTAPDVKLVRVKFPFENKTDKDITIKSFDAPCTCMNALLLREDKKEELTFKPGDKAVLTGVLDLENFKGTIDKQIVVNTDQEGEHAKIALTARVTIPIIIGFDKENVSWVLNDEKKAIVAHIKVNNEEPIHIVRHTAGFGADEDFSYKFETIKAGREYKVTVTPKSTKKVALGMLKFYTDSKIERYKRLQLFMTVKKPKEEQKP